MTTYTSHGLPILETTDKIAAVGDGLRQDLNEISTAANTAITAEGVRAETAAKGYADTKDTDNRAAWAAADTAKLAEAKSYADTQDDAHSTADRAYTDTEVAAAKATVAWDRGTLAADLNTVQSSGFWNVTNTALLNLPVAVPGSLVSHWSSTTGVHIYTTREATPRVYFRTYLSGAFGGWGKGETGARLDAIESLNTTQDGRLTAVEAKNSSQDADITNAKWDKGTWAADLNTAQSSARYAVNVTNLANQPVAVAGTLQVFWGSTTGTQVFTTREAVPRVYYRSYLAGAWGTWNKGEGWQRGSVPSNSNLDLWYNSTDAGVWQLNSTPSTVGITGLPADSLGTLTVDPGTGFQIYKTYGSANLWYRALTSVTSKAWSAWNNLAAAAVLSRGGITNGTDLNTWYTSSFEGVWKIGSSAAAATMIGLPEGSPGTLTVENASGNISSQVYKTYSGKHWFRSVTSITGPTWSAWKDLTVEGAAPPAATEDYALKHLVRQNTVRASAGGIIGTGGKPWIVIRADDYQSSFRTKVAPVLRANDLPCIMATAINYITAQSTYPEVEDWHVQDAFQVWSHSYTHGPASTDSELTYEIVQSADDMETNMPAVKIHGWVMPGTGAAEPYGGYDGITEDEFYGTTAGKLLLSRYGIVYGSRGTHLAPQGGLVIGQGHATFEKSTLQGFQDLVNAAKAGAYSLVLMFHPGQLDNTGSGYMTTATFTECMEWLAGERNAGNVLVGTANAIPALDPTTTYRHNLLTGPFTSLTGWTGAGWTVAGGIAISPASTNALSTVVRWDASKALQGGARETHLVARSAAANSIRVHLYTSSGVIETEKTFTLPGDGQWHDLRKFFTIPMGADVGVNLFINSTTGVSFNLREANMWAS